MQLGHVLPQGRPPSLSMYISYRRRGATWFESRVIVATMSDSATSQDNCSLLLEASADAHLVAGDFCHLRQEVVFPVGVGMRKVTVQLLDDAVAEGEESFFVQLLEEEGLTNAILHDNIRSKVTITDVEDCELLCYRCIVVMNPVCPV